MVATTKVYTSACFLVLVIGVYFQRVPRLVQDHDWVNFQGAPLEPLPGCMNESWPDLKGDNMGFWKYEWDRHGSCIGLDQEIYFNKACALGKLSV
ncbi:hypothetical protein FH972_006667 [Carpinus fangiana]|uniref:Uncharacterized protein n=1 Tax=Carpinus fangiana TaxID=176857 RepID=A0A5N6QVZ2_9ROSI|nr:hypothetical protein FH972_006667 [Carpinus fangiana]